MWAARFWASERSQTNCFNGSSVYNSLRWFKIPRRMYRYFDFVPVYLKPMVCSVRDSDDWSASHQELPCISDYCWLCQLGWIEPSHMTCKQDNNYASLMYTSVTCPNRHCRHDFIARSVACVWAWRWIWYNSMSHVHIWALLYRVVALCIRALLRQSRIGYSIVIRTKLADFLTNYIHALWV